MTGAVVNWLLDGVFTWLAARIAGVLGTLQAFMTSTLFTSPDVTVLPQVQALAQRSAAVVDATFVLAVVVAGGLAMTHGSVQIRYALKDLIPRLVVGFVASSFGVRLCSGLIQVADALTAALIAPAATGPRVVVFVKQSLLATTTDPAAQALAATIALVIVVLYFQVLLSAAVRIATLLVVAGLAPVGLACYALPQTQPVTQLWWRTLLGALATPILQGLAFSTGVDLILNPDHTLPALLGVPGAPGSATTEVINLFTVACLLMVTVRIPKLVARYATRQGTPTSPLAVVVRAVVMQTVIRRMPVTGLRRLLP